MAFHDVRLSDDVERGAQGGPNFKTTVIVLSSGFEKRNIDWSRAKGSWDVGYGIQSKADYENVIDFFYARQGRAHSFRFKDWADFEITAQAVMTTDGSTSTVQMFKNYISGGTTFARTIEKPLASGWVITVNAVSQTVVYDTAPAATEVAITTLTGLITLGSTHAATSSQVVAITGEFDNSVRFDTDALQVTLETYDAGAIPTLPITEVRGE